MVTAKPDSLYENIDNLVPGTVLADEDRNYLSLIKPTSVGWAVQNLNTKATRDVELVKDMTSMRFVGSLDSMNSEGIYVTYRGKQTYLEHGDHVKKVFFTANVNYHEDQVYVVNIPRSQHGDPACVAAKTKELRDFENYDVYDVVDKPQGVNTIATESQKPEAVRKGDKTEAESENVGAGAAQSVGISAVPGVSGISSIRGVKET